MPDQPGSAGPMAGGSTPSAGEPGAAGPGRGPAQVQRLSDHLVIVRDTCNVYLLCAGREAVAVDFGDGAVLDHLAQLGIDRVTDVLMTHHHRDQGQGLHRAVAHGARVWVPPVERDLFERVDEHWQARELLNSYNNRQDRFSLLEPIPIAGPLAEYRTTRHGGFDVDVIPTPGHTVGSVSLLTEVDGRRVALTGDLIAGPGQVWSLAATQWTYNGGEGIGATILSALDLKRRAPELLLPSHGRPMHRPAESLDLLLERLGQLHAFRHQLDSPFFRHAREPFAEVSPHLLQNLTSNANSYVLLSETGKALIIDYGYDFSTGLAAGADRAARRPWLYTLPALKEHYGVEQVEVAIPTHYHDDHLAGFNLLRDVEGTQVWAGETMVDVLEHPDRYDLPCLWYDPIPVDRSVALGHPIRWHEHEITLHPLPGHTLYAVAIGFEVDGRRVLALGDQLHDEGWLHYLFRNQMPIGGGPLTTLPPPRLLNYVYRNRFRIDDYRTTAELYRRLRPQLMLFGHWPPAPVTDEYLDQLVERGARLEALHRDLLAVDDVDLGAEGTAAWVRPYQSTLRPGDAVRLSVEALNPCPGPEEVIVRLALPPGWEATPPVASAVVPPGESTTLEFVVSAPALAPAAAPTRRARVAADVTVGGRRLGQQAEALVSVA